MQTGLTDNNSINAKPFLKWAGGKTQLLEELEKRLPEPIKASRTIETYVEPFIGGGAVFFYLRSKYRINKSFIFDINKELILGYRTIQNDHMALIDRLKAIQDEYFKKQENEREAYYYRIRSLYNFQAATFDYHEYNEEWIERTSRLIFLNKTCYNGLYRQNSKGEFNVPFGRYKNPTICDALSLIEVNKALQDTEIVLGDFKESDKFVEKDTLVYLDPPYRPLSTTSSFTAYAKEGFTDEDQKRLADYFRRMSDRGAYIILSNSDPKNEDPHDEFFDDLYKGYMIDRVPAKRFINCDTSKRGEIRELIITNQDTKENADI